MLTLLLKKMRIRFSKNTSFGLLVLLLGLLNMNALQAQTVVNYQCTQTTTSSTFPLTGKTLLSPTTGFIDDAFYNLNLPCI